MSYLLSSNSRTFKPCPIYTNSTLRLSLSVTVQELERWTTANLSFGLPLNSAVSYLWNLFNLVAFKPYFKFLTVFKFKSTLQCIVYEFYFTYHLLLDILYKKKRVRKNRYLNCILVKVQTKNMCFIWLFRLCFHSENCYLQTVI